MRGSVQTESRRNRSKRERRRHTQLKAQEEDRDTTEVRQAMLLTAPDDLETSACFNHHRTALCEAGIDANLVRRRPESLRQQQQLNNLSTE